MDFKELEDWYIETSELLGVTTLADAKLKIAQLHKESIDNDRLRRRLSVAVGTLNRVDNAMNSYCKKVDDKFKSDGLDFKMKSLDN